VPQRSVITAKFGVSAQAPIRCRREIKVHPHPNVHAVKDLGMEQPDEIHHENRAFGIRHRRTKAIQLPPMKLREARGAWSHVSSKATP
jgi:hypothetical protein